MRACGVSVLCWCPGLDQCCPYRFMLYPRIDWNTVCLAMMAFHSKGEDCRLSLGCHCTRGRIYYHPRVFLLWPLLMLVAHVHALDQAHIHESRAWHDHVALKTSQRLQLLVMEEVNLKGLRAATSSGRYSDRHHVPSENLSPEAVAISDAAVDAKLARTNEEVGALMSFRNGLSGGNNVAGLRGWNASDSAPCSWTGVSCSLDEQHVASLSLRSHGLAGSISLALHALGRLQFLQSLDLSDNNFSSSVPGSVLVNFSSLSFLNLSHNQISGEIPHQVGELKSLQSLVLTKNNLQGQIPRSIGNCTRLSMLHLDSNKLSGQIPKEVGRLSHLRELLLGTSETGGTDSTYFGNYLVGSIPPSLGNCSSLEQLNLDFNPGLTGQIPPELSHLQSLAVFALRSCSFNGVIPEWMGNLTNLHAVWLQRNQFHGPAPVEFGKLQSLRLLYLSENNLTGSIPSEIGNCTSLKAFSIGSNLIAGVIPSSLENCTALSSLDLGPNPLMDSQRIPHWISSLTQLTVLFLEGMNLYGVVPSGIGRLHQLEHLGLFNNTLSGPIPLSLSNCTSLLGLQLGTNRLTGAIPSELGLLPYLYWIGLFENFLTGPIPISITNLSQLTVFVVANNSLEGTIDYSWDLLPLLQNFQVSVNQITGLFPSTLGNCSNLLSIMISQNKLTGEIPTSLGNLSLLGTLFLSRNYFYGTPPADLARCTHLVSIDFSKNNFTGSYPPYLSGLFHLVQLLLSSNQFSGIIPSTLSNLTQLRLLDLSHNQFVGNAPGQSFSRMPEMEIVNLSDNFFSGSLSADWSKLLAIQYIDLSTNMISGSIPKLDNLKSLESLDLSFNKFSGNIPASLASIPALMFLNASYNHFTGPLPPAGAFHFHITAESFLGNPGLCGAILGPTQQCRDNAAHSRGHCNRWHCAKILIPVCLAGLLCTVFALAMVVCLVSHRVRKKKEEAMKGKNIFTSAIDFGPNLLEDGPKIIQRIIKDDLNVIGASAQSIVYKGSIPGHGFIAIKTFIQNDSEGMQLQAVRQQLLKEASKQSKLRHRNVVKMLGFCSTPEFMALLLEYMPQGSLHDHLYRSVREQRQAKEVFVQDSELLWEVRFCVAADIIEGMTYLHHDCPEQLIHGDLKPSNVLLGDTMVAKLADFGISRFVNQQQAKEFGQAPASKIRGTVGYMPPEYAFVDFVSTKGDVYSLGILLLEMLSGKPPLYALVPANLEYRDWNLQHFLQEPFSFLDPILHDEAATDPLKKEQMMQLAKVAFLATQKKPESRPSMKEIRLMAAQIKDLGLEPTARKTRDEILAADEGEIDSSGALVSLASVSLS